MTCHWPRCRLTLYYDWKVCAYCVLAAVWPHTFTIRYCYLLWYMICWTELSGSTFTKAIDLLFFTYFFSKWQGAVCHEWGGWDQLSHYVPVSMIELNTFPLGLVGALPHVQSHCGVLYKLHWSQMIMKKQSLLKPFHLAFEVLSSFLHAKQAVTFVVCIYLISARLLINAIYMHFVTETKPLKCFQIPYSNGYKFLMC